MATGVTTQQATNVAKKPAAWYVVAPASLVFALLSAFSLETHIIFISSSRKCGKPLKHACAWRLRREGRMSVTSEEGPGKMNIVNML